MTRRMSEAREREFKELSEFVKLYVASVASAGGVDLPSFDQVSLDIVQRFGRSKALEGMRQAANDALEHLRNLPPKRTAEFDADLRERAGISVAELSRRYARSFRRIVKRGAIRTDTEYYMVNSVVVDLTSDVSEVERHQLQALLTSYEDRPNPTFQRTATPPLN